MLEVAPFFAAFGDSGSTCTGTFIITVQHLLNMIDLIMFSLEVTSDFSLSPIEI